MDKNEISSGNNINAFTDRPISKVHKFYLSGDVKPAAEYVTWFETIRNASENDVIMIHINSYGGDLFTAIQFMRVFAETKANIVASVEGACMSAATIIFLSAKHWEISNHSMFMFHNYSSGSFGKGGEMYDNIMHERAWSQTLWKDVYSEFLTTAEIDSILHNKDIWMSGEEVTKRLQKKIAPAAPKKAVTKKTSKKNPAKKTTKSKTNSKKSSS
jgi:ATP-dependent protease ClpP protease subunit